MPCSDAQTILKYSVIKPKSKVRIGVPAQLPIPLACRMICAWAV